MAAVIVGTSGADILADNSSRQSQLHGGAGNDVYLIDAGYIYFDYGYGTIETVFYSYDSTYENLNAGTDSVILSFYNSVDETASLNYQLAGNVENFSTSFYGGQHLIREADLDYIELSFVGGARVNVLGNALANSITGGAGDDTLDGGLGNDTLVGGDGNDIYYVDSANDRIIEQENLVSFATGDLFIDFDDSDYELVVGPNVLFDVGGDSDTVYSYAATYTLAANVENLVLVGAGQQNGTGNAGQNILFGSYGNNTLSGLGDSDYLYGAYGDDLLLGGDGDDYLDANFYSATNYNAFGADTLNGGNGNDYLEGADGFGYSYGSGYSSIYIYIPGFRDSLIGGEGNDTLSAIDYAIDTLAGGAGNDVYYTDGLDAITEVSGTDTVYVYSDFYSNSGIYSYILSNGIENGYISTFGGSAPYSYNTVSDLVGNAGENGLYGDFKNNLLSGLAGNDFLQGNYGADTLIGGDGNDTYAVDSNGDQVIETNAATTGGIDTVFSSVNYTLGANVENLVLVDSNTMAPNPFSGTGNSLANSITGNDSSNLLIGGAGNDTLNGGLGIDFMIGGLGNDTYIVDNTNDAVTELAEPIATNGRADRVVLTADFNGTSSGTYIVRPNIENVDVSATFGGVFVTGNELNNSIVGGSGNDILDGRVGNDTLVGGAGDDTYFLDGSTEVITELATAGSGIDTVHVLQVATYTMANNVENAFLFNNVQSVTGNISNNVINGNGGNNTLSGLAGNDALYGHYGRDTLLGGAGNDTLDGGAGADSLDGGLNDDTYIIGAGDVITADAGGIDTVRTTTNFALNNTANGAGVASIEHLIYTGSSSFTGTGNALNNSIVGGDSDDFLYGNAGLDTLDGGEGDDYLEGGAGNDTYFVDSVNDFVAESSIAGSGIDTVISSLITTYLYDNVENLVYAEGSLATNGYGNSSNNRITGNSGDNNLYGYSGNDTLDGGAGNDVLNGDGGTDSLIGGAGSDTYYLYDGAAGDIVSETLTLAQGGGIDTVIVNFNYTLGNNVDNLVLDNSYGSSAIAGTGNQLDNSIAGNDNNNTLNGLAGNDFISGGEGGDTLNGGDGNDFLYGNAAIDSLVGGAGNDILNGGDDNDIMVGGTGDDSYYISSSGDVVTELAGVANGNDTAIYESTGTYTLANNVENADFFYSANASVLNFTGNTLANTIFVDLDYRGVSVADTIRGGDSTVAGGSNIDTLIATIGEYNSVSGVTAESITTELMGIENILLYVNAPMLGSNSWQINGFNGTTAAHNQLTVTGGNYGAGGITLSGFGENVDVVLQNYFPNGEVTLSGAGPDADINVVLDNFNGQINTTDASLNFTATTNGVSIVDLNNVNTQVTTAISLTGTGDVSLLNLDDGTTVELDDFASLTSLELTTVAGNSLTLDINNTNARVGLGDNIDFLNINSIGSNFLDVTDQTPTLPQQINVTGQGLLALASTATFVDASAFTGEFVAFSFIGAEIIGGSGDDYITGSGFDDILSGGIGLDVLFGNGGSDTFVFDSATTFESGVGGLMSTGIDLILDFISGGDRLLIDNFGGLTFEMDGTLSEDSFISAPSVDDDGLTGAYILHDSSTGALYYDAGAGIDAIQFAQLGVGAVGAPATGIQASDIYLIT